MKRKTLFLLILIIILSAGTIYSTPPPSQTFKDVKSTDWYYANLEKLAPLNIVQGIGDNLFAPNDTVMFNQYLKMVDVALTNKTYDPMDGSWDKPYINQAYDLGLISNKDFNYNTPINRYDMAVVIVKACKEEYGDYNQYKTMIKDFNTIPKEYQEYVLKAYSKGIITGYTDGTFGGTKTMLRSEATAVIARLIDPEQRILPGTPPKEDPVEKDPVEKDPVEKDPVEKDPVEKDPEKKPRDDIKVIGGGYNDLIEVPIYGNEQVEIFGSKGPSNEFDVDFSMLLRVIQPREPQYTDLENLFIKRFGKDNKQVAEIMNYVKKKTTNEYNLPYKRWQFKGQTVKVASPGGMYTIEICVWRWLLP